MMKLIKRCNCDQEKCGFAGHFKNIHVDDECIHHLGSSHKVGNY